MRRIDELYLDYPFPGSPTLQDLLLGERYKVGRLHARTLMKGIGTEAIYRRLRSPSPIENFILTFCAGNPLADPLMSGPWTSSAFP